MGTEKKRVAVLGGGVGGITAAFALSATAELRERYEVTVHQLGWRIGGKGASGRNRNHGQRIEEHGLHVWFGFYENAFRVMRAAYEELDRPAGAPLATLEDAFHPADKIVLYDKLDEGWHAQELWFPPNDRKPGEAESGLPHFWDLAEQAIEWAIKEWDRILGEHPTHAGGEAHTPGWFGKVADLFEHEVAVLEKHSLHLLSLAAEIARTRGAHVDLDGAGLSGPEHLFVDLVCRFRDWVWTHGVKSRQNTDPLLKTAFTVFDVFASTLKGVVDDDVLERGWEAIDDREWAEWLQSHGAKEVTIGKTPRERAPILRSVYDVAFAYPGGDIDRADCAAGTATNDLLRLAMTYRGAVMWKMQAGMGDTVFTPFYEVLAKRGVKFRFFDAVTAIRPSGDGTHVSEIEIVSQVGLRDDSYAPLVEVNELPCWPSEPIWEQLDLADGARPDFEAEANPLGRPSRTLKVGEDFDEIVLGISLGALSDVAADLLPASPRMAKAVETGVTVSTQAFQLWMRKPTAELGWKHGDNTVAGCYVEPLDTYCDMDHLLVREDWTPEDDVEAIAYFCGVLEEIAGESHEAATARAREHALDFLRVDLNQLWPDACQPDGCVEWTLLRSPDGVAGPDRLAGQYWRANTVGSERYVLTPAGTVKDRLDSNDTGFSNLVAAGDWTRNGINGGCVEAAVISGLQAARGLIGHDRRFRGEDEKWLTPR